MEKTSAKHSQAWWNGIMAYSIGSKFFPYTDTDIVVESATWAILHENDIYDWLEENTVDGKDCWNGMIISFKDNKELLMFVLRWQ